MLMLRKLLSLNISLIYVINVFRFSCIAIMIVYSVSNKISNINYSRNIC